MFGATSRLNIRAVSYRLFKDPSGSMELIRHWLEAYMRVTAVKDRTGDRAYRESCMFWAAQLVGVISAMTITPGKSFSALEKWQQNLIKKFYEQIEGFLSSTPFPAKPRSKLNQSVQEMLVTLKFLPAVQPYESIYFLEDLEALAVVFKGFFLSHPVEEDRLVLVFADETVVLPLQQLRSIPSLKPLLRGYIWPLMRIALHLSPERLTRLETLKLVFSDELVRVYNTTAFSTLFKFFQALEQDVKLGNSDLLEHTKALFRRWREETPPVEVRDLFDGAFGVRADDLLPVIEDTLCDSIKTRVARLLKQTVNVAKSALSDAEFLSEFGILISQYDLDLNTKAAFIFELFKLNFQAILFSDSILDVTRYIVSFLERLSLDEAELKTVCDKTESLTEQEQYAILARLYFEAYQVFLTKDSALFESFLLVKNTLLASALKRIEASRLSFLFQELVPSVLDAMPSLRQDESFMLELQASYQSFGVTFPFQHDGLTLPMGRIEGSSSEGGRASAGVVTNFFDRGFEVADPEDGIGRHPTIVESRL